VNEVQRNEFGTPPPMRATAAQLRGKFRVNGTVQNVFKELLEDLAVQLTIEELRQCYGSSHNLQEVSMATLL
jgi:hypothetical protein